MDDLSTAVEGTTEVPNSTGAAVSALALIGAFTVGKRIAGRLRQRRAEKQFYKEHHKDEE